VQRFTSTLRIRVLAVIAPGLILFWFRHNCYFYQKYSEMTELEIYCYNTRSKHTYPMGTSLLEISRALDIKTENMVCGAIVNHQVRELSF
jgi:hypothetical protein